MQNRPFLGLALAGISCCVWTIAYILIKQLQETYPTGQTIFLRYLFCMPWVMLWVALAYRFRGVATTRWHLHLSRSIIGFSSQCCLYISIAHIPLANSMALYMLAPILVAALSAHILKEKVGAVRWGVALIGFLGALIILQPQTIHADRALLIGSLAGLGGALFLSLATMGVRQLGASESNVQINFHFSYIALALSSLGLLFGWESPDMRGWASFALLGLVTAIGQYLVFKSFAMAPTALISPVGYLVLPLTALGAWLTWEELPQAHVYWGSAILVLAGITLALTEHRARKNPKPE